nr:MATE family efflux transporter [Synechococcus elongatus]
MNLQTIRAELRQFLQLAIPLAAAQVAQAAVGFVDTVMMGRLGPEPLAAGGLASALFQFILATASGAVMAVSPLVAEAQGAGKDYKIAAIARQGLWLSVLLGLPVMVHHRPISQRDASFGAVGNHDRPCPKLLGCRALGHHSGTWLCHVAGLRGSAGSNAHYFAAGLAGHAGQWHW